MPTPDPCEIDQAIDWIPRGLFLVTSAHEGLRSGVLTQWVQQCLSKPPMVMIALPKGTPVEPLIRDSHCFVLCQIGQSDRILHHKFAIPPLRGDDPFDTLSSFPAPSGAPVVELAMNYLDCELHRKVELDHDHWLYAGLVRNGAVLNKDQPMIHSGSPPQSSLDNDENVA